MKFLVMCQTRGSGAYCVAFEAYVVKAKNPEAAKQLVTGLYGKLTPHNVQIVPIPTTNGNGIVATLSDEWCE